MGGYLRSLGALTRQFQPTQIYTVFEGEGSSYNRKNLISEYKGNRNQSRITKWAAFDSLEEEDESKSDQIVRLIQYLKTLPVRMISIRGAEADDTIAYLGEVLPKDKQVIIVSSDKDYLQLINENISVYRPIEKKIYNVKSFQEKYKFHPQNFIIYKTLLGDNSDNIKSVKGLGEKKFFKLFPEIKDRILSLDDIFEICKQKLKDHVIYARILQNSDYIEKKYKVMDLDNPLLSDNDKIQIESFIKNYKPNFQPNQFLKLYEQDKLGGLIRNTEFWLRDLFSNLK
jgi:DNA polymerase-1